MEKIWKRVGVSWEFIYLLMIAVLPLVVNPLGSFPYEIPKQVFLILGMVFAFLYFIFLPAGKISFNFNKRVFVFAGFWLLSLIISTVLSVAPAESFWGSTERMQGLYTWILYLLHFFICLQIFREERWRGVFFNLVAGVGVLISVYAILQHFGIDPLDISDINEASGRSFATIGQPNFLGQYLIFPFFIVFVRIFGGTNWRGRGILMAALLVIAFGLWTTLNRASILGITVALLLFFARKFRSKFSVKTAVAGMLVIFGLGIFLISIGGLRSISSRMTLVKPVVPLIQNHWLIGAGPETMYQTYQSVLSPDIYLTENLYDIPDRIHNETLQILLDQGMVGLILFAVFIVFLGSSFLQKKSFSTEESAAFFAIIAYLVSVQFSFSIAVHVTNLLAMLAISLVADGRFYEKILEFKNGLFMLSLKAVALVVSVFYLYTGFSVLMADIHFERAIGNYFSNDDSSINSFDLAVRFNSHSRYYLYNASNLLSAKDPNIAKERGYLEKLGAVTSDGYHYHLAMANYYSYVGEIEKMEESYAIAAEQAPNWPLVWQQWGMKEFEGGRYEKAIEKYEKLVELAPPYWKWSVGLENRSFEDWEKHRLFKKNNDLFYIALRQLAAAYGKTRREEKALRFRERLLDFNHSLSLHQLKFS